MQLVVLFPSRPHTPGEVEPDFAVEAAAAEAAGFKVARVDVELLLGGEAKLRGLDGVPKGSDVIYRGWLLKEDAYERLWAAVLTAGYHLYTNLKDYLTAYHLPLWEKHLLPNVTPISIVFPKKDNVAGFPPWESIFRRISTFEGPCILKDYVKSQKHHWFDACYIADSRDTAEVRRVTQNFLDLTGDLLVGGLVYRQFEKFKVIGTHPKSKLPLVNEWRAFMVYGQVFHVAPYWATGDYSGDKPDLATMEQMARPLKNLPFIAADFAQKEDGSWMLIEINDGGSAGIPEGSTPTQFYSDLMTGGVSATR